MGEIRHYRDSISLFNGLFGLSVCWFVGFVVVVVVVVGESYPGICCNFWWVRRHSQERLCPHTFGAIIGYRRSVVPVVENISPSLFNAYCPTNIKWLECPCPPARDKGSRDTYISNHPWTLINRLPSLTISNALPHHSVFFFLLQLEHIQHPRRLGKRENWAEKGQKSNTPTFIFAQKRSARKRRKQKRNWFWSFSLQSVHPCRADGWELPRGFYSTPGFHGAVSTGETGEREREREFICSLYFCGVSCLCGWRHPSLSSILFHSSTVWSASRTIFFPFFGPSLFSLPHFLTSVFLPFWYSFFRLSSSIYQLTTFGTGTQIR